jgi:hypothetical protein
MSLNVSLIVKESQKKSITSGIFIRENGQTVEISQEEWDIKFPGKIPLKFNQEEQETNEVYSANITHNLNTMAEEVGIYKHLWRPEEIEITKASELIEPLKKGIKKLKSTPEKYKKFNPENGWGTYEGFVSFVENYLDACCEYPEAEVEVDR